MSSCRTEQHDGEGSNNRRRNHNVDRSIPSIIIDNETDDSNDSDKGEDDTELGPPEKKV